MAVDRLEAPGRPPTGAESLLLGLKRNGIDRLFANAGTDFPPIIEAFAARDPAEMPEPVTVPHETAAVAMAHGFWLVTGRAQAAMVHVNVGLANAAMGVINAASDDIPMLVLSGRTPITEHGRPGGRATPIQYGQEMYDQASLVRDLVKFHYEMRYPEQGEILATRAVSLALSAPTGPVHVSLPREPLMERVPDSGARETAVQRPVAPPAPDPAAIEIAAAWLSQAEAPLIVCQRSDPEGRAAAALARLANAFAIPVVEPFAVRNVMASEDPMLLGYDPAVPLAEADVVLVVDSGVPWIEARHRPGAGTRIVHVGPDPLFRRMPIRGYRCDLAIASDPALALAALQDAMPPPGTRAEARREEIARRASERREAAARAAAAGCTSPMTAEWISECLSEAMDERAVVFSELGVVPAAMRLCGPNRMFCNPHSGGLGWALPAALGAQLADRGRRCIACIGDGSYIFANPVACHQIAEALELPVLVLVKNNGMWNAVRRAVLGSYPDGAAARANRMALVSLEPSPDYTLIAQASRAHAERVEHGRDLPAALERAIKVIRTERRAAVLELHTALSDRH